MEGAYGKIVGTIGDFALYILYLSASDVKLKARLEDAEEQTRRLENVRHAVNLKQTELDVAKNCLAELQPKGTIVELNFYT